MSDDQPFDEGVPQETNPRLIRGFPKFSWRLYQKAFPLLPVPTLSERILIRESLCLPKNAPLPRCPGKGDRRFGDKVIPRFESKGDFSHSPKKHICDACRCKHVAGYGTKHYGVGYCYWHDIGRSKEYTESMTVALQQGYPHDPVKYRSDRSYIEQIQKMAEEANSRLNLTAELDVLRAHLLELEELYSKKDAEGLTMRGREGAAVPMTDDVKIDRVVKLVKAVGEIAKQSYIITENDYVHVDECKIWLWGIYKMLEGLCKRLLVGELKPEDLLTVIQSGIKSVTIPRTGRRK